MVWCRALRAAFCPLALAVVSGTARAETFNLKCSNNQFLAVDTSAQTVVKLNVSTDIVQPSNIRITSDSIGYALVASAWRYDVQISRITGAMTENVVYYDLASGRVRSRDSNSYTCEKAAARAF
jgi:hypothetical protein